MQIYKANEVATWIIKENNTLLYMNNLSKIILFHKHKDQVKQQTTNANLVRIIPSKDCPRLYLAKLRKKWNKTPEKRYNTTPS